MQVKADTVKDPNEMATQQHSNELVIGNPKFLNGDRQSAWYPFHASFSPRFVMGLLSSARRNRQLTVLDSWNGTGTTTASAFRLGYNAYGFDLNPAMVVIARARCIESARVDSIERTTNRIIKEITDADDRSLPDDDALGRWFSPGSFTLLRTIECAIHRTILKSEVNLRLARPLDSLSPLACFFYVALFDTVRSLLTRFLGSNPTWIRAPQDPRQRLRPSAGVLQEAFTGSCASLARRLRCEQNRKQPIGNYPRILLGSSESIPLPSRSIDLVVSSPPYCTRIDYGIATLPELAVLGYRHTPEVEALRKTLMGTPTVHRPSQPISPDWGTTCVQFLNEVANHPSKASTSYYLKTFTQYFSALYNSTTELARVLRPQGRCVLVVQDSFYKDLYTDLAGMTSEMATRRAFSLERRVDFDVPTTLARVNNGARRYRHDFSAKETVLVLRRR